MRHGNTDIYRVTDLQRVFTTRFRTIDFGWQKIIVFFGVFGGQQRTRKTFDDSLCKTRIVAAVVTFLKINVKKMQFARVQYNEWTTTSVSRICQWVMFNFNRSFCFVRVVNRYYILNFSRRSTVVTDHAPCVRKPSTLEIFFFAVLGVRRPTCGLKVAWPANFARLENQKRAYRKKHLNDIIMPFRPGLESSWFCISDLFVKKRASEFFFAYEPPTNSNAHYTGHRVCVCSCVIDTWMYTYTLTLRHVFASIIGNNMHISLARLINTCILYGNVTTACGVRQPLLFYDGSRSYGRSTYFNIAYYR